MMLDRVRAATLSVAARERRLRDRLSDWLVAPGPLAVAAIVMVVASYFVDRWSSANSDTHLFLTVSIVDRGTLNIDPFARYTSDIAAAHGHFYADKAPGLSLLAVPVYWLLKLLLLHGQPLAVSPTPMTGADMWVRYALAVVFAAIPTGLVAALLYRLLHAMGVMRGWCATLALAYGLGTIARPFATLFFSHQLATLLCFAAFYLLWQLRRGAMGERAAPVAVVAGLLVGYALISELPTAIIAAGLGVYTVTIPGVGRRLVALLGLGMAPPLVLFALYNRLAFGSFFGMGYGHLAGPQVFREGQAQGFFGVTFPHLDAIWGTTLSPYRGLFFLSPLLLLAVPGCLALARRTGWRPEAWLCAGVGLAYQLFNWSYFEWDGGSSMGPRQILPSLPFLVLPIGALLLPGAARRWRTAVGVLAGYSIALVELCAAVNPLFGQEFISPLTQYVLPRLAGLIVPETHPWQAQAQLGPALLHTAPLFLSAKLAYNWGQLPDLPGLSQLYPLGLAVALILLWATLRAHIFPWLLPRLRAGLRAFGQ